MATTVTDADGAFRFGSATGAVYKVQADYDGLSSPLSPPIDLRGTGSFQDLALLVPSPLLMLAASCHEEFGVVVVGSVYDDESGVVLPGARVSVSWRRDGLEEQQVVEANTQGHYRFCGLDPSGPVRFKAEMLGSMGDLRGELRDRTTGEPIRQAVVRLRGTSLQGVTDSEGRFTFPDVQPGTYTLEIQHLGYSIQTSEVEVPEGQDVLVRMQLSPQAVQLDEVVVTARATLPGRTEMTSFRRRVIAGTELARAEERGAMAPDVLRATMPGLRVTQRYTEFGPEICIETNRRIQSLQSSSDAMEQDARTCESMVLVVIDGLRVSPADVGHVIMGLSSSEIESIEFLQPTQAATLYGIGRTASNGVVLIWTRGRGPLVSPSRNRR